MQGFFGGWKIVPSGIFFYIRSSVKPNFISFWHFFFKFESKNCPAKSENVLKATFVQLI